MLCTVVTPVSPNYKEICSSGSFILCKSDKHLRDGGGPCCQQRFALQGGEEGVRALEA